MNNIQPLFTSLSPQEEYNLYGTISKKTMEKLLDFYESAGQIEGVIEALEGIPNLGFPEEDFLDDAISEVAAYIVDGNHKRLPGLAQTLKDLRSRMEDGVLKANNELDGAITTLSNIIERN